MPCFLSSALEFYVTVKFVYSRSKASLTLTIGQLPVLVWAVLVGYFGHAAILEKRFAWVGKRVCVVCKRPLFPYVLRTNCLRNVYRYFAPFQNTGFQSGFWQRAYGCIRTVQPLYIELPQVSFKSCNPFAERSTRNVGKKSVSNRNVSTLSTPLKVHILSHKTSPFRFAFTVLMMSKRFAIFSESTWGIRLVGCNLNLFAGEPCLRLAM